MEPQKKYPAFLKPYLADCSNRLEIHPSLTSFMKSSDTVLRNHLGRRWTVGVAKIADNMYLQANWRNFVEENYIELGDLLVFHYNCDQNILDLKNLGKMASEKHVLEAFGLKWQEEKKESASIKQEPVDDIIKETTLKRKHADSEKVDDQDDRPSKKTEYMNGNTYFVSKIMKDNVGQFYIPPSELMNDKGIKLEKFMTVLDNGREWRSKVSRTGGRFITMSKWKLICSAYTLNVGDEFVCEIVAGKDGSKPYIQVHAVIHHIKNPALDSTDRFKEDMSKTKEARAGSWIKPPEAWCKLNASTSFIRERDLASFGGLIRDSKGEWLVGYAKCIRGATATVMGLLGLREGLKIAWERGIAKLEVEIDSNIVVGLMENGIAAEHPLGGFVADCKNFLHKPWEIRLRCIQRELNQCAGMLVKKGHGEYQLGCWLEPLPEMLEILRKEAAV